MFPYTEIMSYFSVGDHPAVARTLATGYPTEAEKEECALCGAPATVWRMKGGYRCFECARKEFEDLDDEEAAELLGFEVIE